MNELKEAMGAMSSVNAKLLMLLYNHNSKRLKAKVLKEFACSSLEELIGIMRNIDIVANQEINKLENR